MVVSQKGSFLSILGSHLFMLIKVRLGGFMNKVGYARVSTQEQNLDLQIHALEQVGCTQIFKDDGVSAVAKVRPGFEQALSVLGVGDTLMIWKLDRAFRSVKDAVLMLELFEQQGIKFCCLTEQIDTTTPMGRSMYQIRSVFAELERSVISERTIAGMKAARLRGARIGRPRKLSSTQVSNIKLTLRRQPELHLEKVANNYGVSSRTISRALARV